MRPDSAEPGRYVLGLRILGTDFRLVFTRSESMNAVARAWSRCVVDDIAEDARVVALSDAEEPLIPGRLTAISSKVVGDAISRLDGSRLVLRAFGLADPEGRVLAVAGRVGSVVFDQLLDVARTEMGYVSDEVLVIDDDGSVLPLPKPLMVSDKSAGTSATRLASPDELGLSAHNEHLRLAGIVVLESGSEHAGPELSGMSLLDALTALAPLAHPNAQVDRPIQRLSALIMNCGGATRLACPVGAQTAGALRAALGSSGAEPDLHWVPIAERPVNSMAWCLRDGRVRQVPFVDAVETGDGALVLTAGRPLRLGPLALTLWRAALEGATVNQLVHAAVVEHGEHRHASILVQDAVERMRDAGAVAFSAPVKLEALFVGAAGLQRTPEDADQPSERSRRNDYGRSRRLW